MSWYKRTRMIWRLGRWAYQWFLLASADNRVTLRELATLYSGLRDHVPWGDTMLVSIPNRPAEILEEVQAIQRIKSKKVHAPITIQDL